VPRRLLQAEGAVVFAAALVLYIDADFSIVALVVLFLAPDLALLVFLLSPKAGAIAYDLVHIEVWPVLLAALGVLTDERLPIQIALIWLAHIGLDRALGYGLRYPTAPAESHLDRV
jgi:uncharacterized protein DUF4260